MTDDVFIALALASLASLYFAATSIPPMLHTRRMKRVARVERARAAFAEARALMYQMARENKLDIRSSTFREFVMAQTFIMRRPEAYEDVSLTLQEFVLETKSAPTPAKSAAARRWKEVESEIPTWPEEMKQVYRHMGAGTYELLCARGTGRFLYAAMRKLVPLTVKWLGKKAANRLKNVGKRLLSVEAELYRTGYKMEHYRGNHC